MFACRSVDVGHYHRRNAIACYWYGWLGLVGGIFGGWILLWLLAKFVPGESAKAFKEMYRHAEGAMCDASIEVHGIWLADGANSLSEILRERLDGWIDDSNEESDAQGFQIELDEILSHSDENLDLVRYFIDFTVTPPETEPDASWAPHAIGLRAVDSDEGGSVRGAQRRRIRQRGKRVSPVLGLRVRRDLRSTSNPAICRSRPINGNLSLRIRLCESVEGHN